MFGKICAEKNKVRPRGRHATKSSEKDLSKFTFFFFWYFCLDTKVPKNQGKKNSARSANQLSGSIKTRHFLLLSYEEMQTTSGFARTAKLIVIHSTATSAFCRACARASWQSKLFLIRGLTF